MIDPFDELLIKNAGNGEETPIEETPAEPPVVEEIEETPVIPEETPVENPDEVIEEDTPAAEETPVEEVEEEAELVFDDWDVVEETEEPEVADSAVTVLSDLGFEGLTVEQAKAKIKELQDAEQVDPLAAVPDNLKKAIELAKQDGDWLQFLSINQVDYSSIDNDVLLANSLVPYFTDAEGNLDREGLDDYMDDMPEVDKNIRAKQLKSDLIRSQEMESQRIEAEAAQRRVEADRELKAALDRTEEIRGLKLKPAHKKKIYEGVSTGQMIQEMFFDKSGKMDMNKVIDHYFNHLYGKQADTYMKQRITSTTKKDMLHKLGNVQVNPKPSDLPGAVPEAYNPQKEFAKSLLGG